MKKLFAYALASLFVFISTPAHAECHRLAWYQHTAVDTLQGAGDTAIQATNGIITNTERAFLNQEYQARINYINALPNLPNSCLTAVEHAYIAQVLIRIRSS